MILGSDITGTGLLSKTPVVPHPLIKRTDPKNIRFNDRFRLKNINFLLVLACDSFPGG
jgi:hypothetical protein